MAPAAAEPRVLLLAGCLALGPAVALGIARFAYALLLPAMKSGLDWSYSQSGYMNSINAAGYLTGALLAAPMIKRFGASGLFIASLILTSLLVLITGVTGNFIALLLLRLLSGIAGSFAFVAGGVLVSHLAGEKPEKAGLIIGLYYGGPGIGIALSGAIIPALMETRAVNWPAAWAILGALSLVSMLPAIAVARRVPIAKPTVGKTAGGGGHVSFLPALAAYFLFATGYIVYMTFMFALLRGHAASVFELSGFWVIIGLATVASSRAWAWLIQRSDDGKGMAGLLAVVTLATALPLLSLTSPLVIAVSGALFGISFCAVATATTALVSKGLPKERWASAIALFTAIFGAGQILGPAIGGLVADAAGNLRATIAVAGALVAAGALLALLQRRVSPDQPEG